jgi:GH24 family phage-related lysozyme (muramidase)
MPLDITIPVRKRQQQEGPNIQLKEKPQGKQRDLTLLKIEEGFKQSVYDDTTGEYIPKGSKIKEDSTIVYPNGKIGGKATIGYGHKVLPVEFDSIYKPGDVVEKTKLEEQLEKDYDDKKNTIEKIIKSKKININDVPQNALSILIRNAFWGVSSSNFPTYFNSMLEGRYKTAADNLKFYDPSNPNKGYTNIYKKLKARTERVMDEILSLY